MPRYIDQINPASYANFNFNQGIIDGQAINESNLRQRSLALQLAAEEEDTNARLALSQGLRAAQDRFGNTVPLSQRAALAGQSITNPFAAVQASNLGNSLSIADFNVRAAEANARLTDSLIGTNNARAAQARGPVQSLIPSNQRPRRGSTIGPATPKRANPRGDARSIVDNTIYDFRYY